MRYILQLLTHQEIVKLKKEIFTMQMKNWNERSMKHETRSTSILVLIVIMFLSAPTVLAQEATGSAKTATISATVLSAKKEATPTSVLDKLAELKKEIASKAAKLKEEVNKKMENKALL